VVVRLNLVGMAVLVVVGAGIEVARQFQVVLETLHPHPHRREIMAVEEPEMRLMPEPLVEGVAHQQ
jgi:hypothetical protein